MFSRCKLLITILLLFLLWSCAKISTPTGGVRDTTPPKVTQVVPESGITNFDGKQIRITFDEYVTLNNPSDNVLISPPLATAPTYSTKGKSVVLKFNDTLKANTTYNLIFTDCIKDYHEGNALNYYHYCFSTGNSIDQYCIIGDIIDAKTLAPAKDFYVLIYKEDVDSLPLTSTPDYITKSQSDGSFVFNNIAHGNYKIFALKDINADYKYNLPNEEIAFLDTTIEAFHVSTDSIADTVIKTINPVILKSFMAENENQQLQRYVNPMQGLYKFPYSKRIETFSAIPLTNSPEYFEIINPTRDTITWYFKSIISDSAIYILNADETLDTVYLKPYQERQTQGRGRSQKSNSLSVKFENIGELNKPLLLDFSYPIRQSDSVEVFVYTKEKDRMDTSIVKIEIPEGFIQKLTVPIKYVEKKSYSLMIPDSVFWGYNGKTNDTLKTTFSSKSIKDYGTLIMNYEIPNNGKHYITTLYKGDAKICDSLLIKSTTITYSFLEPATYRVEVFLDENRNGRWDAGDYKRKLQPEPVFAYPQNITIRAYWDSEETFVIK